MPRNQFKTDCDCDCGFEWWAATKRVVADMKREEEIAEEQIDDCETSPISYAGWAGDYAATYKWRAKLEEILE